MNHAPTETEGRASRLIGSRPSTSIETSDTRHDDGSYGDRHVVLGAGQLGTAIARVLGDRAAASVKLVNRGGVLDGRGAGGHVGGSATDENDVEVVAADVADADQAAEACRGATVVYFTAIPPYTQWPTAFSPLLEGALSGAAAAGATFVYADNCYMYGPVDGPIHEDLPYVAETRKGRTRAAMAERVLAAHADGDVRATIGRASDFYGPGVTDSLVGERVFGRVLAGEPAAVLGDPDAPHTYTYIDDFARGLITLGANEAALGDAWHVPSAPALTTRAFVELIGDLAGTDGRVRPMPSWLFALLSRVDASLGELREMRYIFDQPFVVDSSKFAAAFDVDPTPHEEAIERTLDWYRKTREAPVAHRP